MAHLKGRLNKEAKKRRSNSDKNSFFPYKYILWALPLFIIGGIAIWASYALYNNSPDFVVRNIVMKGAEADSTVNYNDLKRMLDGQNIFKLALKDMRNYMLNNYRELLDLRLTRVFPNTVIANITLRKPVAQIYQTRYYPVDKDGIILSGVKDYPDERLPIISGIFANISGQVGDEADSRRIKEALLLLNQLKTSGILNEHKLVEIDISNIRNVIFFLEDGLEIKIGHEDYALRLENLKGVLQDPKLRAADIRYIDLRFKEPVIGPKWKR